MEEEQQEPTVHLVLEVEVLEVLSITQHILLLRGIMVLPLVMVEQEGLDPLKLVEMVLTLFLILQIELQYRLLWAVVEAVRVT